MGQPGSSSQPASSSQPQSSRQPTGYSQPPSSSVGSSQPPSSRQPRSCSQPPSSGQPVGSSQPPTWRTSQHVSSGQQSTSICDDTSIVRRVQQAGRGRGDEVMILQLLQEVNKQKEVGEEKEHQHQQEETKGLRLWDLASTLMI